VRGLFFIPHSHQKSDLFRSVIQGNYAYYALQGTQSLGKKPSHHPDRVNFNGMYFIYCI
jgi:hypothetical protein